MTWPWRVWVMLLTLLAAFITGFGMQAGMSAAWWPVAGL